LKPGYHISGSRVETRRLQATGQLESTAVQPHPGADNELHLVIGHFDLFVRLLILVVALQVAFERKTLKPVFQLIGYRLWV
jgi:hypothetical protein